LKNAVKVYHPHLASIPSLNKGELSETKKINERKVPRSRREKRVKMKIE
jgi:hypothetical protein